jgi:hypothetical protein
MKIELEINQWNYILNALAQRPYGEVAELIAAIQAQAPKNVDGVSVNE